jgi:hypothetical protein
MAFRADIVKMIEDLVTKIEEHHFKINYSMKQDFVTFLNSYFKYHLDQTDINFSLNTNLLYADTDGVKVIIATDITMAFDVPGCTIPMRNEIEAFIVVDEVVAYDSYKMRRFRKAIQDSSSSVQNAAPAQAPLLPPVPAPPLNIFTTVPPPLTSSFSVPTTVASTPAATTSSTPSATTQTPSSFNFSTPPATTPAPSSSFNLSTFPAKTPTSVTSFPTPTIAATTPTPSSFNFSTAPATSSAFHLSTIPTAKTFGSPTNLFASR